MKTTKVISFFNIKGGNDELHLSLANINYLNKDNKKFSSK